jgi:hypothetical protein
MLQNFRTQLILIHLIETLPTVMRPEFSSQCSEIMTLDLILKHLK